MPLPRNQPFVITLLSSRWWNAFCIAVVTRLQRCSEESKDMKIYLLMMLITALLTAIRFTSVPEQQSKTLPQ
jgi:hypothetical protein